MLLPIDLDPTDAFHTYRIQNLGDRHIQVLVDDELQLDTELTATGGGTEGITIGDLGGCGASSAVWDYLAYDTAAPGTETTDDDGDGIEAAVDVCAEVADQDQLDADADRVGDECDICPSDAFNDQDQDGLCADEDVCPNSPDNADTNGNGICDTDECLNGGVPVAAFAMSSDPVAIAAPCLPGTSPNCCPFYGVDPVLPPPSGGASGGGGSGAGGAITGGSGNGVDDFGNAGAGGSVAATGGSGTTTTGGGSSSSGSDVMQQGSNTNSSGSCAVAHHQGQPMSWAVCALLTGCGLVLRRRAVSARGRCS
jgi:hypothetical protein